jgi:glycosyltransferase involved in cell wall biosynthesis
MRAVILDGDISYPPNSGKRLRTLNLMLRLARRHRLTYIGRGQGDGEEARQARTFLGDHGIETIVVDAPLPRKSGPLFYARLAANLLSPLPYSVATHASRRVREAVRAFAARNKVDLWQLEWTAYAGTLRDVPAARKVIIAHNVEATIWQRYYETARGLARRWFIKNQWQKWQWFETRTFQAAERVVAVSPEDAAIIRDQFGMERVDVVDNGIDRAYLEAVQPCPEANHILFLGSLEWRPNLDAVGLLLDRVFPAVLAREPAARLSIVGRNPPAALVQRVRQIERAELHANLADVRPFLARAAVMAVPLRIGGGSRLKILEALAAGLPVVSTRVGAEGLSLRPGSDLVVVDDVEQMAAALVDCLRHPDRAREMAERGRRYVLEHYDWDTLADKLEQVWEKAVQCPDATPQAMLAARP